MPFICKGVKCAGASSSGIVLLRAIFIACSKAWVNQRAGPAKAPKMVIGRHPRECIAELCMLTVSGTRPSK